MANDEIVIENRGGRREGAGRPKSEQALVDAKATITQLNELARGGLLALATNFDALVDAEVDSALNAESEQVRIAARHFLLSLIMKTLQIRDEPLSQPLAQILAKHVVINS